MRGLSCLCLLIFSLNGYGNLCEQTNQTAILLNEGNAQLEDQHYLLAIKLFDRGIEQIGDAYLSDNLLDDTDTKLLLSQFVQQEGKLSQAAHLRQGVLSSRLAILQEEKQSCSLSR